MTPEEHLSDVMYRARCTAARASDAIRAEYPPAREVERIREERPEGWEEAIGALDALARACAYFEDVRDLIYEATAHAINREADARHARDGYIPVITS